MGTCMKEGGPVLHVVVIGFHHKKGCQLEFAYPPLIEGNAVDSHELPNEWKHLPSLALPDGAHNYDQDTIYFHLESLGAQDKHTIYGVSCYRQMDAGDLVNKTSDVTRGTVQKSVCVLSKLPLYGPITAKLELITHAYFEQGDFTIVSLLEETFRNVNVGVGPSTMDGSQVLLGFSCRDLIVKFRYKILILFKLLLLERRVIFFMCPVKNLCNTILSLISLFPGMVECGLKEAACYSETNSLSSTLRLSNYGNSEDFLEVQYKNEGNISKEYTEKNKTDNSTEELSFQENHFSNVQYENKSNIPNKDTEENMSEVTTTNTQSTFYVNSHDAIGKEVVITRQPMSPTTGLMGNPFTEQREKQANMSTSSETMIKDDSLATLDIAHITHVKRIQDSEKLSNSDVLTNQIRENSKGKDPLENLDDITARKIVQYSGPSVHGDLPALDLDSPESLAEIDQEDVFSWDQDKLHLEISDDLSAGDQSDSIMDHIETDAASSPNPEANKSKRHGVYIDKTDRIEVNHSPELSPNSTNSDEVAPDVKQPENITQKESKMTQSESRSSLNSLTMTASAIKNKLTLAFTKKMKSESDIDDEDKLDKMDVKRSKSADNSVESSPEHVLKGDTDITRSPSIEVKPMSPVSLTTDECGFPLAVFTKGSLCHPYLSLQYIDLLEDVNVRSFMIGATNYLYKQKRHLSDVVVEFGEDGEPKINIKDNELKKQLSLTTADLRFADYLVKVVAPEGTDAMFDGTDFHYQVVGWEGGDEWIRAQFKLYLMTLLRTAEVKDSKLMDDFNPHFIGAYLTTHNYSHWLNTVHSGIEDVEAGHPYHGQVGLSDMKLKLATSMLNTERGRKINAAVVQTGKAVGGALTSAKSAVSSWFSSLTTSKQPVTKEIEDNENQ